MFIGGFGLSFYYTPNYAGILIIYLPIFIILISGYGAIAKGQTIAKITQNAKLGGYTEEILSALKLVIAFGQEEYTMKSYGTMAFESRRIAIKAAIVNGFFIAVFLITMNFFQVYSWWVAAGFVSRGWNNARTG
jgi:ATP-binding cassette subfamily B protein